MAKVYEVDPLICPRCRSEMKLIAVITNPAEVAKILRHLIKIGRAPPGLINGQLLRPATARSASPGTPITPAGDPGGPALTHSPRRRPADRKSIYLSFDLPIIRPCRERTAANLARLRVLLEGPDSPHRVLRREGGWTALIESPRLLSEEELALGLLR
ncbi:MAG: hypothetical protein ABSG38_20350 [Spirochaetia bacterium]|jgi:hypothetical protein